MLNHAEPLRLSFKDGVRILFLWEQFRESLVLKHWKVPVEVVQGSGEFPSEENPGLEGFCFSEGLGAGTTGWGEGRLGCSGYSAASMTRFKFRKMDGWVDRWMNKEMFFLDILLLLSLQLVADTCTILWRTFFFLAWHLKNIVIVQLLHWLRLFWGGRGQNVPFPFFSPKETLICATFTCGTKRDTYPTVFCFTLLD